MQLVQIPECGGFNLSWADRLRKSIAKKKPEEYNQLTKEYFENMEEKGLSKNLCNYVWNVLVATSRGYGFNKSHTLAYSLIALQEMNLAFKFPVIYWNTACLIADSGGKEGSTDYAKMAQSVNRIRDEGVSVSMVDINNSALGFEPDERNNQIMFGLKALINMSDDTIELIARNRPYVSLTDFYYRVKPKKQEMISLIKAGAFNEFCGQQEAMVQYLWLSCDKKQRLTLQNMPGLMKYNLIPQDEKYVIPRKIYEFNRYLKDQCKIVEGYKLDIRAIDFLNELGLDDLYNEDFFVATKDWDKVYQEYMDIFRDWIKENKEEVLDNLNTAIFMQGWEKYAQGNISAWEMEAMCFYYHDHELKNVNMRKYGLSNFYSLPEDPVVEKMFSRGGSNIPIYKLTMICGTCIAKNKDKGTVFLLTTDGVVPVKFRKEYFSLFDRQVMGKKSDGSRMVLERSWFNRGQKILVQGMRRGNEFIAKKYASSKSHQLYKIDSYSEDGTLVLRSERYVGEEIEDAED